jgi:cell cycle arrest protein BUB3
MAAASSAGEFALANPPTDGITQVIWANSTGAGSELLLASSWDRSLRLYDTASNLMRLHVDLPGAVLDCCFDGADTTAFAVGVDKAVTAVDLSTKSVSVLGSHSHTSRCLVWAPGINQLFSGGWDGKLMGWDTRAGKNTSSVVPLEGERVSNAQTSIGEAARYIRLFTQVLKI